MDGENLISWNIPNFITFALMLAIIWIVLGVAGHIFVRGPAQRRMRNGDNTTTAPGGVSVVA